MIHLFIAWLKTNLVFDASTNPAPVRTAGPLLSEEPAGKFIEDYEYSFGLGDLDQYNGRVCKTPDFPSGRYCYFITIYFLFVTSWISKLRLKIH